jgi:membrane protein
MFTRMATKEKSRQLGARAKKTEQSWADRVERWLPQPIRGLVVRARQDEILLLSAALGFYAVVSIVPLVVLVASLISLVLGDQRLQVVAKQLGELAPKDLGADKAILQISEQATRLSVVAFLAALWPATSYGSGLARAFDHLSRTQRRGEGFRGRWLALLVLLPLFVLGGIVGSYVGWVALGSGAWVRVAGVVLAFAIAFVAAGAAIALIYRIFPGENLGWRPILLGASSAAVSISVLSLAVTLYVGLGANFSEHFGSSTVATLVLVAVWMFLANALTLVGYKIAQEVAGQRPHPDRR